VLWELTTHQRAKGKTDPCTKEAATDRGPGAAVLGVAIMT
jgi:hypothetical protein